VRIKLNYGLISSTWSVQPLSYCQSNKESFQVPPFLAYYAVVNNNQTLLQESYNQINLYRNTLRQSSGLWAHIVEGSGTSDSGLWATGNAWAAMGMLRVLATMKRSQYAGSMGSQMTDLQNWTEEILTAIQGYIVSRSHVVGV
jgi:rhamnogalacturonyl hydrolase YesR